MIERVDKNKHKITVECGIINGKRKRKSVIFYGSKQEAKIKEIELIKEIRENKDCFLQKEKLTFLELVNIYLEDYCKDNLKENTIYGYKNLLKVILPELGSLKVKDITTHTLQRYYNKLKRENGYCSNTIRHHYVLINSIFEIGIKWQLVSTNPNKRIEKPKANAKKAKIYNYEQLNKFLEVLDLEPIYYQAPMLLCIDTGMRREELNGLKWENVDLERGIIRVREVRLAVGKDIVVTTPKTDNSNRDIDITQKSLHALKKLKEYQNNLANVLGNKWNDTGYVFVNDSGLPYYPDTLSKIFKKIVKKYNLDDLTLHQLRHTCASLLLHSKEDIVSVSERLGHSNVSTTLDIYAQIVEELEEKSITKTMSNILSSN